jgi:hypothetical protein
MLMADFVAQTVGTQGHISKGVRVADASRDFFVDGSTTNGPSITLDTVFSGGLGLGSNGAITGTCTVKLPYFGTDFLVRHYGNRKGTFSEGLNSWGETVTQISASAGEGITKVTGNTLAVNEVKNVQTDGQNDDLFLYAQAQIATPIHTSSHYQSFETPFLHELVGGDRNMEQNNLVVSPDGKTWDEVTRNKDYLGSNLVLSATNTTNTTWGNTIVLDDWRGVARNKARFNKDSWAIAYDRLICLKDGVYEMQTTGAFDAHQEIKINGDGAGSTLGADGTHSGITLIKELKRGDYIQLMGDFGASSSERYSHFNIKRIS